MNLIAQLSHIFLQYPYCKDEGLPLFYPFLYIRTDTNKFVEVTCPKSQETYQNSTKMRFIVQGIHYKLEKNPHHFQQNSLLFDLSPQYRTLVMQQLKRYVVCCRGSWMQHTIGTSSSLQTTTTTHLPTFCLAPLNRPYGSGRVYVHQEKNLNRYKAFLYFFNF